MGISKELSRKLQAKRRRNDPQHRGLPRRRQNRDDECFDFEEQRPMSLIRRVEETTQSSTIHGYNKDEIRFPHADIYFAGEMYLKEASLDTKLYNPLKKRTLPPCRQLLQRPLFGTTSTNTLQPIPFMANRRTVFEGEGHQDRMKLFEAKLDLFKARLARLDFISDEERARNRDALFSHLDRLVKEKDSSKKGWIDSDGDDIEDDDDFHQAEGLDRLFFFHKRKKTPRQSGSRLQDQRRSDNARARSISYSDDSDDGIELGIDRLVIGEEREESSISWADFSDEAVSFMGSLRRRSQLDTKSRELISSYSNNQRGGRSGSILDSFRHQVKSALVHKRPSTISKRAISAPASSPSQTASRAKITEEALGANSESRANNTHGSLRATLQRQLSENFAKKIFNWQSPMEKEERSLVHCSTRSRKFSSSANSDFDSSQTTNSLEGTWLGESSSRWSPFSTKDTVSDPPNSRDVYDIDDIGFRWSQSGTNQDEMEPPDERPLAPSMKSWQGEQATPRARGGGACVSAEELEDALGGLEDEVQQQSVVLNVPKITFTQSLQQAAKNKEDKNDERPSQEEDGQNYRKD